MKFLYILNRIQAPNYLRDSDPYVSFNFPLQTSESNRINYALTLIYLIFFLFKIKNLDSVKLWLKFIDISMKY